MPVQWQGMQKHIYDLRYSIDKNEWRARAKRDLIFQLYQKFRKQTSSLKMLDFGCGTGVLQLELRKQFPTSKTYGIDVSKEAIDYCMKRRLKNVSVFNGRKIPFQDEYFDLVTAIDVLEHVKDDNKAIEEIYRVLKPNGIGIFLVPAHMSIWSTRDIRLKHFRRYEAGELNSKLRKSSFKLLTRKNVDFSLFFVMRLLCSMAKKHNNVAMLRMETGPAKGFVNETLYWYERMENFIQRFTTFPIGTSIVIIVTKPKKHL